VRLINIKLLEVKVENYKLIDEVNVQLSKNLTCFIGDNATGKTTLLEGISRRLSNVAYNDITLDSEYIFEVKNILVPNIKEDENILDSIRVILSYKNGMYDAESATISGHEDFRNAYLKSLDIEVNEYRKFITNIYDVLKEIRDELMKLPEGLLDVEVYGRKEIYFDLKGVTRKINEYKNFLSQNSQGYSKIGEKLDYIDFDYNIDYNLFDISFIKEDDYLRFREEARKLSLEFDGEEYDIKEMDGYYYSLKEKFDRISTLFSDKHKDYLAMEDLVKYKDGEIYSAVYKYNQIVQKIIGECKKYILESNLISSSYFDHNSRSKIELNTLGLELIRVFGLDLNEKNLSELSDGEKWLYSLVNEISNLDSKLVFIDEPGMYLNPILQNHLLEVFETLIEKGYQIIYSTHIPSLVALRFDSIVYTTEIDKCIKVKRMNLEDYQDFSKFTVGDLLIMSSKKIILVEGECDELLLKYFFRKYTEVDLTRYNLYYCNGHAISQMIDFCHKSNIDYVAIVDLDKKEEHIDLYKDRDNYDEYIIYVGTSRIKEMEGFFSEEDFVNLCEYKKGERKMDVCKMKNAFDQNYDLSGKLKSNLKTTVEKLKLD